MSQQQNPLPAPEPLVKPFSIRHYALACRHRNILNNWPFPEKCLHMCLNLGLTDVLPPFDSHKGCSNLIMMQLQDDSSKETESCTTKAMPYNQQHKAMLQSSINHHHHVNETSPPPPPTTLALMSNKAVPKDLKRRRGRRRCKKRLMADILAAARRCSLEDTIRMNKFFYADETVIENVSMSEMKDGVEENSCRKKAAREFHDHEEVANNKNIGMNGKGKLLLKFKLNGCNVNMN